MTQYSEVKIIGPDLAKVLLDANRHNRDVSATHVSTLARDMKAGKWLLTHQGIAMSSEGVLLDGQHRLRAVVLAGVEVPMQVTYDADPKSFPVIDVNHSPRTISQIAKLERGAQYAATQVAAAKVIWHALTENRESVRTKFSESEVFEILDHVGSDVVWTARYLSGYKRVKNASVVAAFAFAAPIHREPVADMMTRVRSRTDMTRTMAAYWNAIDRIADAPSGHGMRMELFTVTLRAIMFHIEGREVRSLYVKGPDAASWKTVDYFSATRRKSGLIA